MIGFFSHCRHDENDLITAPSTASDVIGHLANTIGICYRSATKFLNDESHRQIR